MENCNPDILIADDDEQISYLLNFLLTREGYSVLVANDGKEALEAIEVIEPPKLAILDYMMPHENGLQIVREIRKKEAWNSCQLILLTAKAQEQDIVDTFDAGANDYITKPFQPGEFMSRIKMLLRRAK